MGGIWHLFRWKATVWGPVLASPAIGQNGTIYVGSEDHYLYAIVPSGKLKWRFRTDDGVSLTSSVSGNLKSETLYFQHMITRRFVTLDLLNVK